MKKIILTTTALSLIGFSSVDLWAQAQAGASANAAVTLWSPISSIKTSDLNFGQFIIDNPANTATIVLTPGTTATGAINPSSVNIVPLGATHTSANYNIAGEPTQVFLVGTPTSNVVLSNGTSQLTITPANWSHYSQRTGVYNSGGLLTASSDTIRVGATGTLPAGSASGAYTGPPFAVTFSYP